MPSNPQDAPPEPGSKDLEHMIKLQSMVMQGLNEGVFIIGGDDKIHDINAAIEDIFGYPREFYIGRNAREDIWTALKVDLSIVQEGYKSWQETGSWDRVVTATDAFDNLVHCDVNLFAVGDDNGADEAEGFHGDRALVVRDITPQLQAERTTKLQSLVMQGMRDSVFIINEDDIILEVNETVEKTLGLSREQLVGRNAVEDVWPALGIPPETVADAIAAMDGPNSRWTREVRVQTGPDQELIIDVSLFSVDEGDGSNSGRVLIAHDKTASVEASRATRLQSLVMQGMKDAVFVVDAVGRLVDVNQAAVDLLGYPRDFFVGQSVLTVIWPKLGLEQDALDDLVANWYKADEWTKEIKLVGAQGNIVLCDISMFSIKEADGMLVARGFIARDVTQAQESARALKKSQEDLFTAQQIAHLGSWEWSIESNIATCSPEMLRLYGLDSTQPEVPVATILSLVHPDDADAVATGLQTITETNEPWSTEYRVVRPYGEILWISARSRIVAAKDGVPISVQGTVQDITAQKAASTELFESEERLRDVVGATSDMVWATNEDHNVVFRSDRFTTLTGLDADDLPGLKPWEHEASQGYPEDWLQYRQAMESQKPFRGVRSRSSFPNAPDIIWESSANPVFDEAGHFKGYRGAATDITDQVRNEIELRESEQRYRHIVSATSDLIWETDADDRMKSTSENFIEVSGQPVGSNYGSRPWDRPEARNHPDAWQNFRSAIQKRETFRGVHTTVSFEDGTLQYWDNSGTPAYDEEGQFQGYRGASSNITAQVSAEEDLRHSEQRLRDILSATSDMVWETDHNFNVSYVSNQYNIHSGNPSNILIGIPPWMSEEAQRAAGSWAEFRHAMENHQPFRSVKTSVVYNDGHRAFWSISGQPVFDDDGAFIGYRGASSDITSQVAIEEKLQRRDVENQAIMSNAPVGLASTDAQGIIQSFNPAATEIFGYEREEILGQPIFQLFPEGFEEENIERIREYLGETDRESIAPGSTRATGRRKVGEEFPVDVTMSTTTGPTGRMLIVASFVDMTEQQETQEKLRHANRMEAVGQLTGGIAHDFNNLMMSMQLNLEFLLEKVAGDAESEEFAQSALSAITRGSALTSRLLSFSRQQKLSERAININTLISDMYTMLRRTMPDSMDIETKFDPHLWPATIDPHQLENALLNLAINARDAMPDSGTLTIQTYNHPMGTLHPKLADELAVKDHMCVAITDTGTGITQEILDQVIEPFFTTKEVGKGSGLGLSMVYGFVNQSGGHLSITSEVGTGTTVEMFFPRTMDAETNTTPTSQEEP
jgi:PAS domain S-box-containing protein